MIGGPDKLYPIRSSQINNISDVKTRINFLRNYVSLSLLIEWNKLLAST